MLDLGTVRPGSTIRFPFSSFDKDDGSSITMTNYAAADILIYKDGNTTARASTAGFTATTDFSGKTGKQLAVIDLADNTTAGFYNAGSEYIVAIDAVTVDGVTTGGWIARFFIGYAAAWFDTTIATLASQTSFTLTVGPAEDDALNGQWVIIHDIASAVQCGRAIILDYVGSTKTVTLVAGTTFTVAAGDNISIMDMAPLQPATLGRTLVVDAAGLADATAVKVGPTGAATAQTAGDIPARLPAALVTGRMDSSVGAIANDAITAASIATGAFTAAKFAAGAFDAVWTVAARTLTSFGTLVADTATAVWAAGTRTLTSFGTLVADVATAVWAAGTRTLTAFGFGVTVTTNNDKTGYALSTTGIDAILDQPDPVDGTTTRESLRLNNSAQAGITDGAATVTFTARDLADTKDRITATVDGVGNRTAVTLDLS